MPLPKSEIFEKVVKRVEEAAERLENFGCGVDVPRVQEVLIEAHGILWGSLTEEERDELRKLTPRTQWIASTMKIRCDEIPIIKKEVEAFRKWQLEELR